MDRPMAASRCRQRIAEGLVRLAHPAQAAQGRESMIRASLFKYRRRCGTRGCRCGRGERHQGRALSVSAGGRSRTISLAGLDGAEVQRDVEAYRQWRQARAKMLQKESARVGPPMPKEADGSPRVVLHRNQGYFADNRRGLDYPKFRAEGWPIGSGIAEGAVKQFGMRMKGTGKSWNGFGFGMGAEEMPALCALHRSEDNRWGEHWDRRSKPYVRQPK